MKFAPASDDQRVLTFEVTNATQAEALEITVEANENTKQIFIPGPEGGFANSKKELIKGDSPKLIYFLVGPKTKTNWILFTVKYTDLAGTKYKQTVACIDDQIGTDINAYRPEIEK